MIATERFRASTERLVRHFSADHQVTIRRRHSLKDQTKGEPLAALVVNGAHLAGVTALNLKATGLRGIAIAGMRLSIAGNPTVYTLAADAEATPSGTIAVTLTAALAANAADGAAVTITQPYDERLLLAFRGEDGHDADEKGRARERRVYHLMPDGGALPLVGQQLVDGKTFAIADCRVTNPGGADVRWTVTVGEPS